MVKEYIKLDFDFSLSRQLQQHQPTPSLPHSYFRFSTLFFIFWVVFIPRRRYNNNNS